VLLGASLLLLLAAQAAAAERRVVPERHRAQEHLRACREQQAHRVQQELRVQQVRPVKQVDLVTQAVELQVLQAARLQMQPAERTDQAELMAARLTEAQVAQAAPAMYPSPRRFQSPACQ